MRKGREITPGSRGQCPSLNTGPLSLRRGPVLPRTGRLPPCLHPARGMNRLLSAPRVSGGAPGEDASRSSFRPSRCRLPARRPHRRLPPIASKHFQVSVLMSKPNTEGSAGRSHSTKGGPWWDVRQQPPAWLVPLATVHRRCLLRTFYRAQSVCLDRRL